MRARFLISLLLIGCGAAPRSTPLERSRSPIIGGAADEGDPAVGALWVIQSSGAAQFCTGVMVGPQTFATSAHCFANLVPDAHAAVVFGPDAFAGEDGGGVPVDDFAVEPGYRGNVSPNLSSERDLGLAHLASAVPGPFPELNRYPVDRLGLLGKPVRLVGYGRSSTSTNAAGPKLQVTKTDYRSATDTELEAGNEGGLACRGDSGGPAFFTDPAGASTIVSIDSRGDPACEKLDISTRSDAELGFVEGFMRAHGNLPSCGADGRCGFGCSAPDPDCPCAPDGLCTSACSRPASDPDCPQSCLFDGGRCAEPDAPLDGGCGSASGAGLAPLLALLAWVRSSRARGGVAGRPR